MNLKHIIQDTFKKSRSKDDSSHTSRRQYNMIVSRAIPETVRRLAIHLAVKQSTVAEHALQVGCAAMGKVLDDPERREKLHKHLIDDHELAEELDETDEALHIVDEVTWQKAQDQRETARSIRKDPRGWLLQGMVFCGHDGYALKCIRKRSNAHAYYGCRARVYKNYKGNGKNCSLPFVRADKLETAVWKKLKEVLSDKDKLRDAVDKALADLEAQKTSNGADALAINEKLDEVRARKERLGLAFADLAIDEDRYKKTLAKLNEQEAGLLRSRNGIDPSRMEDLVALEARIAAIKEFLEKGDFVVRDSGLYVTRGAEYLPIGFNAFRTGDGKLVMGEIQQKEKMTSLTDYLVEPEDEEPSSSDEGLSSPDAELQPETISVYSAWYTLDSPAFREGDDQEKAAAVIRNIRALMQLFDIKIFVFDDKVEIRGTIPPQFIDLKKLRSKVTASVIGSGRGTQGVDFPINPPHSPLRQAQGRLFTKGGDGSRISGFPLSRE
ncbi:MAG: zinc ribbon domain-containing protein [Dehalococcoidales bacterium]|nr:zinc ribbon domain-containing protein [Dehalococcoidales bacterium]